MIDIHTTLYNYMRNFHAKGDTLAIERGSFKMHFNKLFKEIDRVAAGLYKMGVRKGDVVMIALPNIPQSIVVTYACSRIGAIASMIHPKISADEFGEAVLKQRPKAVFLSDINLRAFYPKKGDARCVVCHFFVYDYMGLPSARHFEAYDGDGEEIMFYMQSGGTSGVPKTVTFSSRASNALAGNLLEYLNDKFENHKMLVVLPMFHGFGLIIGMHASLCTNMTAVLVPIFNAKKVTKVIAKSRITTMLAVPRMISKLLSYEEFCGDNITSLEDVYVGGDSVGDELVEAFDKRVKESGGHAKLSPGYGLTEVGTVCAVTKGEFVPGSVGKTLPDMQAIIVDEDLKVLPPGQVGELLLKGDQIMSGYLGDEEATKKTFCEIEGVKWLFTGDLFKMDEEGHLFFMGRKKRLIKISGVNVFPAQIEKVAKELDFINDCAAIEYRIDGKPYIKLLVEGNISETQKRKVVNYITKRMSHWNIPRSVECVKEFPRTKIGKTDIMELQNEYSENN